MKICSARGQVVSMISFNMKLAPKLQSATPLAPVQHVRAATVTLGSQDRENEDNEPSDDVQMPHPADTGGLPPLSLDGPVVLPDLSLGVATGCAHIAFILLESGRRFLGSVPDVYERSG